MSRVVITEWRREDIPSIRRITWATWVSAYGPFIAEEDLRSYYDEHYTAEALLRWMEEEGNRGYLAGIDGTAAGYARTRWDAPADRFSVSSLYVLPEFQGRGIGGRLMSSAEERARELKQERIWLGVMEQNVRTLEWYRREGFQFVEEAPFLMGNASVNHLIGYKVIRTEHT